MARGHRLLVTREWDGRFLQEEGRVTAVGEQISCTVEAPPVLEPLAALERARRASGPFPATLDASGRIVGDLPEDEVDSSAAIAAALGVLKNAGKSPATLAAARTGLERLAGVASAVTDAIPPDLFYPAAGAFEDQRELDLPEGETGHVSVAITARAAPGGLLEMLERRVVTRIGDDVRRTREVWSLTRA